MSKVQKVEVVLEKPHTHAGKDLKLGATINVTPRQQVWLAERGIVKAAK